MGLADPVRRALRSPALQDARMLVRRLQAPKRALPDFLIIGAQKSGTSSLYRYLAWSRTSPSRHVSHRLCSRMNALSIRYALTRHVASSYP
jgi:hypothetical protein